jgi:DNA-binding transcriptional MocR family regulator
MRRYERIAEDIGSLIRRGVLPVGQRAPSARAISLSHGVSLGTALRAYELLVDRGFIEALPRSGYYVSSLWRATAEPIAASHPSGASRTVGAHPIVFELFDAARDAAIVPFGSPFISPDLCPLERLARCLRVRASTQMQHPNWIEDLPPGNGELREYIGTRYAHAGAAVSPDEIVLTSGGMEALYLALRAACSHGDLVAIESPAFYGCMQALEVLGLRAVEVPTHPQHGIDIGALTDIIQRKSVRACWLMPTFHNPTGALMPDANKRELARVLARHEIALIEDAAYEELYFGAHRPKPVKAYDTKGLVLHCGSFSKSLSPGYRLGWLAAGRYAQDARRIKTAVTIATCFLVQQAVALYLQRFSYERHLRVLRKTLQTRQLTMLQGVQRYLSGNCRVTRPQGGYYLWVELPEYVDAVKLYRDALASGVSVAPGPIFSVRSEFTHCIRLNCSYPWNATTESAMQTLGELVARCSKSEGVVRQTRPAAA